MNVSDLIAAHDWLRRQSHSPGCASHVGMACNCAEGGAAPWGMVPREHTAAMMELIRRGEARSSGGFVKLRLCGVPWREPVTP